MISISRIREDYKKISDLLDKKGHKEDFKDILNLDLEWKDKIQKVEKLKSERNAVSKEISEKKRNKMSADNEISQMKNVSDEIKFIDKEINSIRKEIDNLLLYVPNIPCPSTPVGKSESDNVVIKEWGEKPNFDFEIKDHLELMTSLNMLDMAAGVKISGSGFPLYKSDGAKLERSLINFMLNEHVANGYEEIFPPFLSNRASMTTTGQLPKFAEDMYLADRDDYFCIPTAEVPLTNIHQDEVINTDSLTKKYTAYSACFRREAGSYGKDTKGLLRLHQFNKVELVKFCTPEDSYKELEVLLKDAESILQKLNLHYRVLELCTGDLSFSAAKCYDIEVWSPFENKYLEVSSCSNFESFQAIRGNIKYRNPSTNKLDYVHTLNGSGVATPRLMVALIETFQDQGGSVNLPKCLQEYMNMKKIS